MVSTWLSITIRLSYKDALVTFFSLFESRDVTALVSLIDQQLLFTAILRSPGADGSVRMFDLRHLEHSTIIYEDQLHTPLLRLAWNKQDPNYLATFALESPEVSAVNIRFLAIMY